MTKEVWVYDDDNRFVRHCTERLGKLKIIQDLFEVKSMSNEVFKNEIGVLEKRRRELRDGKELGDESLFDEVSILVIDYDLLKAFDSKLFLTGETVAYLIRCFSKCDLIIGMNQYGLNTFDLTLKGHLESYCDLNIGSDQLDNPGLWGEEKDGFRPWYWPLLPNYLESFQRKVEDVKEHLDDPLCEVLEIKDLVKLFPRSVIEFIGNDPDNTTFRDFVIKSGNGLRRKDKNEDNELVARIAAARISKWLERLVLPGQDILVDAPHLVYRYPSLLRGDPTNIDAWNKTTSFGKIESLGLNHDIIGDFKFKKDFWLSRHAWFWGKLSEYQKIKEVSTPWEREVTNFRFCEDSSSFQKQEDCVEFVIESDSPYIRRFVHRKHFEGVDYRPRLRLL